MRKFLISLLLASAAASPAIAAPDGNSNWQRSRSDSTQSREERQQAREEREKAREERPQARPERAEPVVESRGAASEPNVRAEAVARAQRSDVERIRASRQSAGESNDSVRQWRSEERQQQVRQRLGQQVERRREAASQDRDLRQSDRAVPHVLRNRAPIVSSTPREGTQPPLRAESRRRTSPVSWSSHWRSDRRYDWHNWRSRNRSLFRLGFYSDPFGWNYRPYSIGWRMWPSYYSRNYWLNDPWQYRLPYAPPGYRWIRYWDDAILVDTWNGQVVDVIYNFFW